MSISRHTNNLPAKARQGPRAPGRSAIIPIRGSAPPPQRTGGRPVIPVSAPLDEQVDAALEALVVGDAVIYQRGFTLVRPRRATTGTAIIEELNADAMRLMLARTATWVRTTDEGTVPTSPARSTAQALLALPKWPGIRILDDIITTPTLRPDGTVLSTTGYDAATRLLLAPGRELAGLRVPDSPTADETAVARDLLWEPLRDFPFVDRASAANALAVLLTAMLRPAIPGPTPLCLVDAPQQGTGKGLLVEVIAHIATDQPAPVAPVPDRGADDELRKRLTALLMASARIILFDNVETTIGTPALSAVLTAEIWSDRVLGTNTVATLPIRTTFIATGNNLRTSADLIRRCYLIRLDAQTARPWDRPPTTFAHPDLLGWIGQHRPELVGAALTLARAWWAAGCPEPDTPVVGGFAPWCRIIGGILATAGVPGFLENAATMAANTDAETTQWEALLQAWTELWSDTPHTASDVLVALRSGGDLADVVPDALASVAAMPIDREQSAVSKLGTALARITGRHYGDTNVWLERQEVGHGRKRLWVVHRSAPALPGAEPGVAALPAGPEVV